VLPLEEVTGSNPESWGFIHCGGSRAITPVDSLLNADVCHHLHLEASKTHSGAWIYLRNMSYGGECNTHTLYIAIMSLPILPKMCQRSCGLVIPKMNQLIIHGRDTRTMTLPTLRNMKKILTKTTMKIIPTRISSTVLEHPIMSLYIKITYKSHPYCVN
jgi:hypothetical protein